MYVTYQNEKKKKISCTNFKIEIKSSTSCIFEENTFEQIGFFILFSSGI